MNATQVTQTAHATLVGAATSAAPTGNPIQKPSVQRTSLMHMLHDFKTELLWVAIFSLIANLLTLTPTLYMLQVFDRVMQSQNEFTLIALTVILVMFLLVMAFAEFIRSRLLVRAGMRFDELMNRRVFAASFDGFSFAECVDRCDE